MRRPIRVLLLEDEDRIRATFERQASRNPEVEIVLAANIDEARQKIREAEKPFDMMLSDFGLRGLKNTAEFVREVTQTTNIPVMVMTGFVARAVGALDPHIPVLAKPLVLRDAIAAYHQHYGLHVH